MTTVERAGAWIGVIGFVATVVWAYANLNNRLDNMDSKMAGIEKTLGSATCNAILTRQIEAIEKSRVEARKALEALSEQYDCLPRRSFDVGAEMNAVSMDAMNESNDSADLNAKLNAVDVLLNESNASEARQKQPEQNSN